MRGCIPGSGKAPLSPQEQLTAQLISIYGAPYLNGLWIADDYVLSGSDVISITARIGGDMVPISAGVYFQASTMGTHAAIINTNIATQGGYFAPVVVPLGIFHAFTVVVPTALPFSAYRAASVEWEGSGQGLLGRSGTSNWFAAGTRYRNGVAENGVAVDPAVYAVTYNSGGVGEVTMGGQDANPARNWYGKIAILGTTSNQPSAGQILAGANACRLYYGIP